MTIIKQIFLISCHMTNVEWYRCGVVLQNQIISTPNPWYVGSKLDRATHCFLQLNLLKVQLIAFSYKQQKNCRQRNNFWYHLKFYLGTLRVGNVEHLLGESLIRRRKIQKILTKKIERRHIFNIYSRASWPLNCRFTFEYCAVMNFM